MLESVKLNVDQRYVAYALVGNTDFPAPQSIFSTNATGYWNFGFALWQGASLQSTIRAVSGISQVDS